VTVLIPTLSVAGEIVDVPTSALTIDVTLPNLVSDYVVSGQMSTPTTCWLSGSNGNIATFSFGAPADAGSQLTILAIPTGLSGLQSVVLPSGTPSYAVTVQTGRSVIPICQWNTQVWFVISGNTWTFYFSSPSGVPSVFSYLEVGPGQNTQITQQPIDPGDYVASIATEISDFFLPVVVTSWNTAIGLTLGANQVNLQFTNGAPAFAATSALVVSLPINVSIFPLPQPAVVQQQQPWIVSIITPEDWALRMVAFFPYPWISDYARSVAGISYAIFLATGTELNYISQQLYYAWQACRLDTAVGDALVLFAQDYFGNNLPKQPGESDNAYRIRIKALLFQPQVTREAIVNAITFAFPGTIVRPIEPWNPSDTGYYGGSYYDYDSPTIPALYGNPQARYQGYFEIQLAPATELAYSLWGYDFASAYDSVTGWFFEPVTALQTQIGQINNLINQIVLLGTQIFVKYIAGIINPFSTGGSFNIATGRWNFTINVPNSIGFYLFFCQLSQPISIWQTSAPALSIGLTSSAPVPSGTILNYLAIENSTQGVGIAAINQGDTNYQYSGDAVNNIVLIQPEWNTSYYYTGRSVNAINYIFTTPAPVGIQANVLSVPISGQAGYVAVTANALTATIALTVNQQNIPLVVPNWNTIVGCVPDPVNNQIILTFSTPAPADSSGEIMFCAYNLR
jgi:hypothetical protein